MAERGTSVGKAYVQIMPSSEGIKGSISKVLNGEADDAGASLGGRLASTIKKAVVAAGIGTAITKSIAEGANLEQSIGGIETLYGDAADAVIQNADKAWKAAGVSANAYMEQSTRFAASLLKSLDGDTAAAAKYADMAIVDMADNANKMGTSIDMIQSAYAGFARGNFTMLDNLSLGFAGSKEGMQELLDYAEKLPEAMGRSFDINSLSDIYDAIHLVQGELGITGATAAEAATTLSGSLNAMKSAANNFLGNLALGRNIDESMGALVEATSTFLFKNLIPAVGTIFKSLPGAIGTFIKQGLPQLLASVQTLLADLAGAFTNSGDVITNAMSGLLDLSQLILNNSGGIIQAGLTLLQNLAQGIANGLPAFIEKAPLIVSNLADVINANAPKVIKSALIIMKTLAVGIIKAIPTLIKTAPQIFVAFVKAMSAMNWMSLGKNAIKAIGSGVKGGISGVLDLVRGMINKIKSYFPFSIGKIFDNIKLPKIDVKEVKGPSGAPKPQYSVRWNAEGGIFDAATIMGYGVGEKGAEAILPLAPFYEHLDSKLAQVNTNNGGGTLTAIIQVGEDVIGRASVNYINGQTLVFGTSPIAI